MDCSLREFKLGLESMIVDLKERADQVAEEINANANDE